MRVALARILLMRPDALLLDEPTNHLDIESIIWLERFLRGFEGALVMTSHDREFLNRLVTEDRRDRRRGHHHVLGQLRLLRTAARSRRGSARGAVRAAAGDARQGAGLHRPVQGPRQPRGAGAIAREEAREDREGRATQAPQGRRVRLPHSRRAPATTSSSSTASARRTGHASIYDGLDLLDPPARALVRHGGERRGQVDAPQARRGRRTPRRGPGRGRREREAGLLRAARDGAPRRRPDSHRDAAVRFSRWRPSARCARSPARSASRATTWRSPCRVLSGGEKARLVLATMLYDPPNFLVLDEPTNHLDMAHQGDARQGAGRVRGDDALRVSRPPVSGRSLEPGPRARTRRSKGVRRGLPRIRIEHRPRSPGSVLETRQNR